MRALRGEAIELSSRATVSFSRGLGKEAKATPRAGLRARGRGSGTSSMRTANTCTTPMATASLARRGGGVARLRFYAIAIGMSRGDCAVRSIPTSGASRSESNSGYPGRWTDWIRGRYARGQGSPGRLLEGDERPRGSPRRACLGETSESATIQRVQDRLRRASRHGFEFHLFCCVPSLRT